MKQGVGGVLAGVLLACAFDAQAQGGAPMTASYSQKDLLKNWTLSTCLAAVATDPAQRADANATASAYMEFGHQTPDAYAALGELAKKYAARRYSGSVDGQFKTMKCIDLFHSRDLNSLATRLAKPSKRQ